MKEVVEDQGQDGGDYVVNPIQVFDAEKGEEGQYGGGITGFTVLFGLLACVIFRALLFECSLGDEESSGDWNLKCIYEDIPGRQWV